MSVYIKSPSKTDVDAIKAKTDNLPGTPADETSVEKTTDAVYFDSVWTLTA